MTCDEILKQLNPEQGEAVSTTEGPVLVLAGAGTGKTRVITFRIAYMLSKGIPAESILGMTFTNKAAREMKERLAQLVNPKLAERVTLGTFHSFCGKLLRKEIKKLGYMPNFTIADESDQLGIFKQAAGEAGCGSDFPFSAAFNIMSSWKNRLVSPREARDTAENQFEVMAGAAYEKYQELLELQNLVDFDDMLMLTYRIFKEYPEVLQKYRERYRYLMVDEYQDTNGAQFTLVKMLAGESCNLCVVGDDDQSIYSWRGADVGNILDFPELFPGTKVVKLEQNYRSCSAILDAANAVISQGGDSRRHTKKLWSALGQGKTPEIITLDNGESEADFIARLIEQLRRERNCSYNDFAILYRSNQLSRQLEQTLRSAQVPYRMVGGQQFFQRREIKDALAYLRLISNPSDDQSLLRLLTAPPRGIGAKAIELMKQCRLAGNGSMFDALCDEEFRKSLSKPAAKGAEELIAVFERFKPLFETPGGLSGKCAEFLKETGYVSGLQKIYKDIEDARKRRDNIDEFISAIAQFDSKREEPATLSDYLEACALLEESEREDEEENASDAVTLTTVHAAKGLEYPVVFVIAMEHGIFPHERALNEGGADEEKRLFYVAVTRAKEELYLLRTRMRMVRGVMHPSRPSAFLGMIDGKYATTQSPEDVLKTVDADTLAAKFAELYEFLNS